MTRPRFLADHDLNDAVVDGVLRRGPAIEFIRARDVGIADRPESAVLAFAADNGWLIVSHDVNTMPNHGYARLAAGQPLRGLLMSSRVNRSQP
jgi:predicted nuclease of predicted toxin-antitoxin system